MTVRPRWWTFLIAAVILAPAIVLASRGVWVALLIPLIPGAMALLLLGLVMVYAAWQERKRP